MGFKSNISKKRAAAAAARRDRQPGWSATEPSVTPPLPTLQGSDAKLSEPSLLASPVCRTTAGAKVMMGLVINVPFSVWGGEWAASTEHLPGMIVNYRRGIFTLKFATCRHGSEALYLKWRHVLGEESYCGALLTLRQFQRFRSYLSLIHI